jgi:hypothetical protein
MAEELFWSVLSRPPTPEEVAAAERLFAGASTPRAALEDLAWSLVNAKEFLFRR